MQKQEQRILLVGGGTGGHFYPLIAIAESLNQLPDKPRLYYAGPDAYDAEALQEHQISFIRISAGKNRRYASLLNFFDLFKTLFGFCSALVKLYIVYPDVVVSKGGYTSVPIVLAAAFLRIPIVVHESDSVIGKANKLGMRFARSMIVSYDEAYEASKHPHTHKFGIPIRSELMQPLSPQAISNFSVDPARPLILIIGGSQGAERINTLLLDTLDELLTNFSVIHQTGKQHFEVCSLSADRLITDLEARKHYHPYAFLNGADLNDAYHLAGLVVSRSGSTSIYEIALHHKPAILIPIPEDISHDQRSNAYAYARTGAAIVMEEKNLTDGLLHSEIDRIMRSREVYTEMTTAAKQFAKNDAASRTATLIMGIAEEH
jgi:UDP-N-acetylglucosamine--N-acetylmuramyl-(pentapeptide) pyrophosphoryl-undecaprenol N-acetylglucosamine transferase